MTTILGYCFEADTYCVNCAFKRLNVDNHADMEDLVDREGNHIHPLLATIHHEGYCADCWEPIDD